MKLIAMVNLFIKVTLLALISELFLVRREEAREALELLVSKGKERERKEMLGNFLSS
jgi:hypothetical protein